MTALAAHLTPIDVPLEKLFLDPNNPRFVGSDWTFIPDDEAIQQSAQKAAAKRLVDNHEIEKLRQIMEANGFLPIDRVVVRSIGDGNYLVMEGNRRICAAKEITGYSDEGSQLDDTK